MRGDLRSGVSTDARRVQLLLIGLGAAFLLIVGLQPLGLPYIPGARFSDAATSHWGAALFLQRSVMRDGEFPFWRDTILGGQPFAANPLNKTAYPLQWLALILPPALHINVLIVLHLLIAGAGMWLLARSLGLGRVGGGRECDRLCAVAAHDRAYRGRAHRYCVCAGVAAVPAVGGRNARRRGSRRGVVGDGRVRRA